MNYTTLEIVKEHAEIPARNTSRDAFITRMLPIVSRAIEQHCRRWFYAKDEVVTYDYQQDRRLFLRRDLISITTIHHGNAGQEVLDSASYFLYPTAGPPYQWIEINDAASMVFRYAYYGGQQAIHIDGSWGYLEDGATPIMISWACAAWMNYLLKLGSKAGIKDESMGDVSISYDTSVFQGMASGPPQEVKGILAPYVRRLDMATTDRSQG